MIHAVKVTPEFFEDVISGIKPFEVRYNDRDYRVGDFIALNEYEPAKSEIERERYSGRSALYWILYALTDQKFCKEGFVILGLKSCEVWTTCGKATILRGTTQEADE